MRKQTPTLNAAFTFSEDDLTLNQSGTLAPDQIAVMRHYRNNATTALIALMLLLAAPGLIGVIIFSTQSLPLLAIVAAILMIVLPALGYALTKAERNKWQADLRQNTAQCQQGAVHLTTSVKALSRGIIRFNQYRLLINGLEFAISEDQYLAVNDGMVYHIYYIPHSEMVLSLEEAAPG
ncbi:hypothetical protein ACFLYO_06220 [Chloroflexota bacterium]